MSIYQHFRPEEHEFIDKVQEWKEIVAEQYAPKLTDFLDPREQDILQSVIGKNEDVKLKLFGGASAVERKRALLYPSYYIPSLDDFQVAAYEISYPKKFVQIEHRQVLGALLGIGLKRSKFGDIIFSDNQVQIIMGQEVSSFAELQFQEIGKVKISLRSIPLSNISPKESDWEEIAATAASLRLDVMIGEIFNLSRQKAQMLIEAKKIKVNWKSMEQSSFECREGDILSVRGFGRAKLLKIEGKTKKDKWRIIAGKQK